MSVPAACVCVCALTQPISIVPRGHQEPMGLRAESGHRDQQWVLRPINEFIPIKKDVQQTGNREIYTYTSHTYHIHITYLTATTGYLVDSLVTHDEAIKFASLMFNHWMTSKIYSTRSSITPGPTLEIPETEKTGTSLQSFSHKHLHKQFSSPGSGVGKGP